MKQQWQSAFGHMTYGIYVLTTKMDDTINGMIASWVSQVSYDPPLIMAVVHPNRYSHDMIVNSRVFGLHIIDQSQKVLLARFKGPDPGKKFSGMDWQPGKTGVPILKDCLAWFEL
jgi:flavin reductase (DIM6/NTAB) family NADH-FMN oxidoreductase RutF